MKIASANGRGFLTSQFRARVALPSSGNIVGYNEQAPIPGVRAKALAAAFLPNPFPAVGEVRARHHFGYNRQPRFNLFLSSIVPAVANNFRRRRMRLN